MELILEEIKLAGFKTFVDPTSIKLSTNLSAVVGPNGCGKSNIIDAVRWVLGETSAKKLRSDQSSDVIFNGSSTRKAVGMASVELVFDNRHGALGGAYASYAKISVKRQITRDGLSTYSINGTKCRLKDIKDLFLGTGLGARSYSVIEQGMVNRLVEAKPEDMRSFFEEASGTSKYKERRRETELRMNHTVDNLTRVKDLQQELERQIQQLERQAKAADRFHKLQDELNNRQKVAQALRYSQHAQTLEEADRLIRAQQVEVESLQASITHEDGQLLERKQALDSLVKARDALQSTYYTQQQQRQEAERQLTHTQNSVAQNQQQLHACQGQQEELQRQEGDDRHHQERVTQELTQAQTESQQAETALKQAQEHLSAAEQQRQEAEEQQQSTLQAWQEPMKAVERVEQELQTRSHALKRLQQQETEWQSEADRLAPTDSENNHEALRLAQEQTQATVFQAEEQVSSTQARSQEAQKAWEAARTCEQETQKARNTTQEHLAVAKAAWQVALDHNNQALNTWLTEQGLAKQRLGDTLQVAPEWQTATEVVLGAWLQAVVLPEGAPLPPNMPCGARVMRPQASAAAPHGTLGAQAQAQVALGAWLNHVHTANTLANAQERLKQLPQEASVITPEGVWVGHGWIVHPEREVVSVLARREAFEQAEHEASQAHAAWQEAQKLLEETVTSLKAEQQAYNQAVQEARTAQQAAHQASRAWQQAQDAAQHRAEQHQRAQTQLLHVRQTMDEERAAQEQAQNNLKALQERLGQSQATYQEAQNTCSAARQACAAARNTQQQHQEQRQHWALRCEKARTQRDSLQQALERTAQRQERLAQEAQQFKQTIEALQAKLPELERTLQEALKAEQAGEAQFVAERSAYESAIAEVQALESSLKEHEKAKAKALEVLHEAQIQVESHRVHATHTQEALAALESTLEEAQELVAEDDTLEAVEERVATIQRSIQRLGPINLAAIEEHAAQTERLTHLNTQVTDLEAALAVLQEAIDAIDAETQQRFQETYQTIETNFAALFPRLFGGGRASLHRTSDDWLTAGIQISAQPPGKRNSSIHQLSGGEKALTAVALVFSIFQLNPAPFCLLDEVDAPLDEANVLRFTKMVQEMSDKTQFIFITHNKVTMETADVLLGITMREPGVSRLVSVNLAEAAAMAE